MVIVCVTGSPQVEAVVLGPGGLLEGMKPGMVVIDCSTAIPSSTQKVAAAVERAGGRFLDAPMTRTPKEAAQGRLNLLVGGDAALFAECRPLLACFAENITHTGAVGAGHGMKLLHNYVSLGCVALIAERLRPYLIAKDPSALRFAMANAKKDLGYYTEMAHDIGAVQQIADAVLQTFEQATAEGGAEALVPELVSLLAVR